MRLNRVYALLAACLFAIEVIIALFVRDSFVRPILGDVLAVMFVYCALLSVFPLPRWIAALAAFLTGVVIEVMQLLDVLTVMGLEDNRIARIVLGTTFTWEDIIAYAAGAVASLALDTAINRRAAQPALP